VDATRHFSRSKTQSAAGAALSPSAGRIAWKGTFSSTSVALCNGIKSTSWRSWSTHTTRNTPARPAMHTLSRARGTYITPASYPTFSPLSLRIACMKFNRAIDHCPGLKLPYLSSADLGLKRGGLHPGIASSAGKGTPRLACTPYLRGSRSATCPASSTRVTRYTSSIPVRRTLSSSSGICINHQRLFRASEGNSAQPALCPQLGNFRGLGSQRCRDPGNHAYAGIAALARENIESCCV
jgi:hypothetical protein